APWPQCCRSSHQSRLVGPVKPSQAQSNQKKEGGWAIFRNPTEDFSVFKGCDMPGMRQSFQLKFAEIGKPEMPWNARCSFPHTLWAGQSRSDGLLEFRKTRLVDGTETWCSRGQSLPPAFSLARRRPNPAPPGHRPALSWWPRRADQFSSSD